MRYGSGRRAVRLIAVSCLSAAVAVSIVCTAFCTGSATPPSARAVAGIALPWVIVSTLLLAFLCGSLSARESVRSHAWGARTCVLLSFLAIGCEVYLWVFSGWGCTLD